MGDGTNGHKHATRFEFTAARNTAVFICSRVVLGPDRAGRFPGDPDADAATTASQLRLP